MTHRNRHRQDDVFRECEFPLLFVHTRNHNQRLFRVGAMHSLVVVPQRRPISVLNSGASSHIVEWSIAGGAVAAGEIGTQVRDAEGQAAHDQQNSDDGGAA